MLFRLVIASLLASFASGGVAAIIPFTLFYVGVLHDPTSTMLTLIMFSMGFFTGLYLSTRKLNTTSVQVNPEIPRTIQVCKPQVVRKMVHVSQEDTISLAKDENNNFVVIISP